MTSINLSELAKIAAGDAVRLRPIIEKEIIHYEILAAMREKGYLTHLTFQGGTALRLCYGSDRLSEDLDFTAGVGFKLATMTSLKEDIEAALQSKFGFAVSVKPPKEVQSNEGIQVSAWQVSVETQPEDRSVPRQRIKIEVANVPSYTREGRAIRNNYPSLPVDEVIVQVQAQEEIMADKLLAFPISANLRYRDLWDLTYLSRRGVQPNIQFLRNKIEDYKVEGYQDALESRLDQLKTIIESAEFIAQMGRFLPAESLGRLSAQTDFREAMYHTVNDLFREVERGLRSRRQP